jgi:hypothetical protein
VKNPKPKNQKPKNQKPKNQRPKNQRLNIATKKSNGIGIARLLFTLRA